MTLFEEQQAIANLQRQIGGVYAPSQCDLVSPAQHARVVSGAHFRSAFSPHCGRPFYTALLSSGSQSIEKHLRTLENKIEQVRPSSLLFLPLSSFAIVIVRTALHRVAHESGECPTRACHGCQRRSDCEDRSPPARERCGASLMQLLCELLPGHSIPRGQARCEHAGTSVCVCQAVPCARLSLAFILPAIRHCACMASSIRNGE